MQIQAELVWWWAQGEALGSLGVKEGITLHEECKPVVQTKTESRTFDFALLEGLHRCVAIRCWQVNCILSGQLNLCE